MTSTFDPEALKKLQAKAASLRIGTLLYISLSLSLSGLLQLPPALLERTLGTRPRLDSVGVKTLVIPPFATLLQLPHSLSTRPSRADPPSVASLPLHAPSCAPPPLPLSY